MLDIHDRSTADTPNRTGSIDPSDPTGRGAGRRGIWPPRGVSGLARHRIGVGATLVAVLVSAAASWIAVTNGSTDSGYEEAPAPATRAVAPSPFDEVEARRMRRLSSTPSASDGSPFEAAELARQLRLADRANQDPFDRAEQSRQQRLAGG